MIEQKDLHINCWYNIKSPMNGEVRPEQFTNWTQALDFEAYGEPIELSKEWLERCGFDSTNDIFYFPYALSVENSSFIVSDGNSFWVEKVINGVGESVGNSGGNTVHSLQNHFFILTGKELTIKEPINE